LFWLLTVCLFVLASLFILVPLWLRSSADSFESEELRKRANIALFHERNNELEVELSTGNIDQGQFESLVLELQQSLLADVSESDSKVAGQDSPAKPDRKSRKQKPDRAKGRARDPSFVIPILLGIIIIPLVAYGLYGEWGYIDDVELMGLFQRTVDNVDDAGEAQALIISLGEIVRGDEEDDEPRPWAWYFLAENFANLGMFAEAEIAYERSAAQLDGMPEKALVLGRVAMAKYINAGLAFTPEILEVIEQARAINPNELSILQLLASDAVEREDYEAAIEYWRLLIQANPNSQQAQTLRANIAAAQQLLVQQNTVAVDGQPVINVNLALAENLQLDGELRVFIAAHNAAREGMPPLAAVALTVSQLPASIQLDNSSVMGSSNLFSAESVYVSALVSNAGVASPQSGDYRVVSESFTHNGEPTTIELVIAEQVP
jgi:cytochrome c-type biogenesis protein CcmI|tara:strand:- start:747 stop:2051 length:1305 start_codon:yes stop_codon:yes gene_type:complete